MIIAVKYIYCFINILTRNKIASLILGVLDAEMCRAKYKYKRRKLLLVTCVNEFHALGFRVTSNNFLLLYLYLYYFIYTLHHFTPHGRMNSIN